MESWDQSTPPLPKLLSYTWKHRLPHMCSTLFSLLFLFPQVPIHKKVDGNMDITHLHCCQTCPGSFFFFLKGTDPPEKNLGAVFRHTPRSTWPWARIPLVVATRHWYVFKKRVGLALKQACTAVVGPTLQSFRTRLHRRIMLSQCGATVRSWCRGSAVTKWAP